MRILTVLTYYRPHWTGLTAHAANVCEGLSGRGHAVTVLTSRHGADHRREELLNGVRVVRLETTGRFSRGVIMPQVPFAAARLIASHDIVHIHTPLPESLLLAWLCRRLGRPLIVSHHGDIVMPQGMGNRWLERGAYLLHLGTGRLADAITSYNDDYSHHSRFLSRFANKLHHVKPPVSIPLQQPEEVRRMRAALGLEHNLLIGFAGRWVEEKGFDNLLRAMPSISSVFPRAHLLFAGETRMVYEDFHGRCLSLVNGLGGSLTMLGRISDRRELANFYAMCDVFATPSRTDMLGLVQVEALLCGTPLVTSDIPGARTVVRETGCGLLAAPENPADLARAVIEVLGSPARFKPDRSRVTAMYDPERSLTEYEEIMERALQRGRMTTSQFELHAPMGRTDRSALAHAPVEPRESTSPVTFEEECEGRTFGWRDPCESRVLHSLSRRDMSILDVLLRNEMDMAFARRARQLLGYLDLGSTDRVLDCGCGMGFHLMAMERIANARLTGVDGDIDRLRDARRSAAGANVCMSDILKLPFRAGSFHKVLMSEVIEHLPHEDEGIAEVRRVMKPGGILAVSVPHVDQPLLWDPIYRLWSAAGGESLRNSPIATIWSGHYRLYRPEDLVHRLEEGGFAVEIVEEATHFCFPFAHFLVYGIGKPLIEKGILPESGLKWCHRMRGEENSSEGTNIFHLLRRLLREIDSFNDREFIKRKRTFVNVLARARKLP